MKNNLAIIPARSGSKRIKNKNIKKFDNKPIIEYTLEVVKNSNMFSKIHVSSDSDKILKVSENYLSEKTDFKRPKNLSNDSTPIFDVLKYVFINYKKIGFNFENILLITPCSPLINENDIKESFKILKKNNFKFPIISAGVLPVPLEYTYSLKKNGVLKPNFKSKINLNSNKFKLSFFDTGNFVLLNKTHIENIKNIKLLYTKFKPYILPKNRALDIDDNEDWEYAKLLHKVNKN